MNLLRRLPLVALVMIPALMVGCEMAAFESLVAKSDVLLGSRNGDCMPDDDDSDDDCPIPDTVPDFSQATFSNPTQINNTYFPLVVGTTKTFESQDGSETTVVEVLNQTHPVMGITCRVVRDRVTLDGVLIEDTHDFFAQDDAGNVWYMGEEVDNYNYRPNGVFLGITHEGAWEAGLDVAGLGTTALPGYIMKASPMPGDVYHQEFYRTEAEDMAEVIALNVPVVLANGSAYSCHQTRDFTPLDRKSNEFKYFASGVGLVLEESVKTGDRVELVAITP